MKREFARGIAESIGMALIVTVALVAWYLGVRPVNWPNWVLFVVLVSVATLIVHAAIKLTKQF